MTTVFPGVLSTGNCYVLVYSEQDGLKDPLKDPFKDPFKDPLKDALSCLQSVIVGLQLKKSMQILISSFYRYKYVRFIFTLTYGSSEKNFSSMQNVDSNMFHLKEQI